VADDGKVPLETVALAMRACQADVTFVKEPDGRYKVTFAKGTRLETLYFSQAELSRHAVGRLSILYDVPKHYFYRPEMIPKTSDG